jgi:hypothetical protein
MILRTSVSILESHEEGRPSIFVSIFCPNPAEQEDKAGRSFEMVPFWECIGNLKVQCVGLGVI